MTRRQMLYGIGGIVLVGVIVVVAVLAWMFINDNSEASAPISAPTLVPENGDTVADDPEIGGSESSGMGVVFRISQEESTARYIIDELLNGQPNTVVGETDQIAGDILVDFETPGNSQIGTLRINVRTLETDSSMRDRTTRTMILQSSQDAFEFSEFVPTAVTGFPDEMVMGEVMTLQITGDLTVRDVTSSVTFEAIVTAVSETRLEGSASGIVQRADYGLTIPNVPRVADVSEDVLLEIDFVALAVE